MQKKFEDAIELAAAALLDAKPTKIILISHNDADGYASLVLLQAILTKWRVPIQHYIFNREKSWSEFLDPIIAQDQGNRVFLILDLGGEISELGRIFKDRKDLAIILDHHLPLLDKDPLPENLLVCNPVQFGFDGLKEIAGATVAYLFAKQIEKNATKFAWLATIGIAGDSLMHVDKLKSYNLEVLEDAVNEGQIIVKSGACLYGGMHEKVKNALAWSILPYVPQVQSSPAKAEAMLRDLKIPPDRLVEYLEPGEVERLSEAIGPAIDGKFAVLPKKKGLLHHLFEHALLLNVVGFKNQDLGFQSLSGREAPTEAKRLYLDHVTGLSKNLTTFVGLPRVEGPNSVLVDVEGLLPPSAWSDTASFASVNNIFDPTKMLFLAGKEGEKIKFSVRCSREFIDRHKGDNVNATIQRIRKKFSAMGGGHTLAGGLKIASQDYPQFKQTLENFFIGGPA